MCRGEEDEDQRPKEPQAAAAETAPEVTAPQAEQHTTGIPVSSHAPEQPAAATHQRAELKAPSQHAPGKPGYSEMTAPTAKQQACPHPFAEVVTLTGGVTICNHCFGLVAFDPLADAA